MSGGANSPHDDQLPRRRGPIVVARLGAIVLLVVALTSLAVTVHAGVVNLDALRSRPQVVASERDNSLYSCLESQLRRLVPRGTRVSIADWGTASPLRVVVATDPEITPVITNHVSLLLVSTRRPAACGGFTIEAVSPSGVVRFGTALADEARTWMRPFAGVPR